MTSNANWTWIETFKRRKTLKSSICDHSNCVFLYSELRYYFYISYFFSVRLRKTLLFFGAQTSTVCTSKNFLRHFQRLLTGRWRRQDEQNYRKKVLKKKIMLTFHLITTPSHIYEFIIRGFDLFNETWIIFFLVVSYTKWKKKNNVSCCCDDEREATTFSLKHSSDPHCLSHHHLVHAHYHFDCV